MGFWYYIKVLFGQDKPEGLTPHQVRQLQQMALDIQAVINRLNAADRRS